MVHADQNISLIEDMTIICEGIVVGVPRGQVIPYHTLLEYLDSLDEDAQGCKEGFAAPLNALECVLEYLQTKDYTITNGDEDEAPQSGHAHAEGDATTKSPSVAFIQAALKIHVEVFLFGLDYDIPELSQEAIAKFERLFQKAEWTVDDMMPVIRDICDMPNPDTLSLRKAVAKLVIPVADELTVRGFGVGSCGGVGFEVESWEVYVGSSLTVCWCMTLEVNGMRRAEEADVAGEVRGNGRFTIGFQY